MNWKSELEKIKIGDRVISTTNHYSVTKRSNGYGIVTKVCKDSIFVQMNWVHLDGFIETGFKVDINYFKKVFI